MAKDAPIVLIEDDMDDQETMRIVLNQLNIKNKLVICDSAAIASDYLLSTGEKPFVIICDINLPGENGLEFKKDLDADPFLRKKSIPFIFYSTAVDAGAVTDAYLQISVQGFFQKKDTMQEIAATMKTIFDYWTLCRHPNT